MSSWRWLLQPLPWIAALLIAALLLLGGWTAMQYAVPTPTPMVAPPTAVMIVLPAPTLTRTPTPVPPTPTPTVPPEVPPSPEPGVFQVGALVQISNTGGVGLRLRAAPGLDTEVRYVGLESEVFRIQDGPVEADGFTWWYLVALYDPDRQGWGAANYLTLVQNP